MLYKWLCLTHKCICVYIWQRANELYHQLLTDWMVQCDCSRLCTKWQHWTFKYTLLGSSYFRDNTLSTTPCNISTLRFTFAMYPQNSISCLGQDQGPYFSQSISLHVPRDGGLIISRYMQLFPLLPHLEAPERENRATSIDCCSYCHCAIYSMRPPDSQFKQPLATSCTSLDTRVPPEGLILIPSIFKYGSQSLYNIVDIIDVGDELNRK